MTRNIYPVIPIVIISKVECFNDPFPMLCAFVLDGRARKSFERTSPLEYPLEPCDSQSLAWAFLFVSFDDVNEFPIFCLGKNEHGMSPSMDCQRKTYLSDKRAQAQGDEDD